jgi:Zn-dependent metalloprotease
MWATEKTILPDRASVKSHFLPVATLALALISAFADAPSPAIEYGRDATDGSVIFIRNKPADTSPSRKAVTPRTKTVSLSGSSMSQPTNTSLGFDPITVASAFAATHGPAFGLEDPAKNLVPTIIKLNTLGMAHVHYQQRHRGIPVWGAELLVHVGAHGQVTTANGRLAKHIGVSTVAAIAETDAQAVATAAFKALAPGAQDMEINRRGLHVLASVPLAPATPCLVWVFEAHSLSAFEGQRYFVNAATGTISATEDLVSTLERRIRDCGPAQFEGNSSGCYLDKTYTINGTNFILGRSEGKPARGPSPIAWCLGATDVDDTYDMIPRIWDYLRVKFNRDGVNGSGGVGDGAAVAWVLADRFRPSIAPGGAGYLDYGAIAVSLGAVKLDIIGHEYTHGLSDSLVGGTGPTYSGESGAIDERDSDFFGQTFKLFASGSTDWICTVGESGNTVRNLVNPSSAIDVHVSTPCPSRHHGAYFYCGSVDNGGIHINSSVVSRSYYLAAMGGNENGCTVQGIGVGKVEQILYRALDIYFTPDLNFNDLYHAMLQACRDLYTEADALKLAVAMEATELDQPSFCSGLPPRVPNAVDPIGW